MIARKPETISRTGPSEVKRDLASPNPTPPPSRRTLPFQRSPLPRLQRFTGRGRRSCDWSRCLVSLTKPVTGPVDQAKHSFRDRSSRLVEFTGHRTSQAHRSRDPRLTGPLDRSTGLTSRWGSVTARRIWPGLAGWAKAAGVWAPGGGHAGSLSQPSATPSAQQSKAPASKPSKCSSTLGDRQEPGHFSFSFQAISSITQHVSKRLPRLRAPSKQQQELARRSTRPVPRSLLPHSCPSEPPLQHLIHPAQELVP
jgi:hypothetical protein